MQPIVLKTINAAGFGDYQLGLQPTLFLTEDYGNAGVLGDAAEPMLQTALNLIMATGKNATSVGTSAKQFEVVKNATELENEMFVDIK